MERGTEEMTSTMTIDQDGSKIWRNQKGQRHRTLGPAVEWPDGTKVWYLNGQFHRTDGPAIEYADGTKVWFLNGRELTFDEWLDWVAATEQARTLLRLKYGGVAA
jgi:hypothetical protein